MHRRSVLVGQRSRPRTVGISDPRPRPRPRRGRCVTRLTSFTWWASSLRRLEIRQSAWRTRVIRQNGLAVARRLGDPNRARDRGRQHLVAEVLANLVRDSGGKPGAPVEHGQDDRSQLQVGIQVLADLVERAQQLAQALERVVLALDRDQHLAACRQRVDRQQPERRRAVDEDVVVAPIRRRPRRRGRSSSALRRRVSRATSDTSSISAPARSMVAGTTIRPSTSGHGHDDVGDRRALDQDLVGAGRAFGVVDRSAVEAFPCGSRSTTGRACRAAPARPRYSPLSSSCRRRPSGWRPPSPGVSCRAWAGSPDGASLGDGQRVLGRLGEAERMCRPRRDVRQPPASGRAAAQGAVEATSRCVDGRLGVVHGRTGSSGDSGAAIAGVRTRETAAGRVARRCFT